MRLAKTPAAMSLTIGTLNVTSYEILAAGNQRSVYRVVGLDADFAITSDRFIMIVKQYLWKFQMRI